MSQKSKAISPYNIDFDSPQFKEMLSKLAVSPMSTSASTPPPFTLPMAGEELVSKLFQIPELGVVISAISNGLLQEIQNRIAEIERLENLIKKGGGSVPTTPDYQEQINSLFKEVGILGVKVEALKESLKTIGSLEDSIKEITEKMENVLIMPPQLPEHETGVFGLYVEDGQWKLWRVTPYE